MEYHYDNDDVQSGWGRRGYGGISHVYIGTPNQRGHGIGSFLGGLFRRVLPLLRKGVPLIKKGAKAIGKEALRAGVNVATDALKRRAEDKIDALMSGSGYNTGKIARKSHSIVERMARRVAARRKKRLTSVTKKKSGAIRRKKRITKKKTAVGRPVKKRSTVSRKKARSSQRTVADIFA